MKREVKIGIFAVAMIGIAWAGIRFLKGFDIFSRNCEYYAAYDQVNGVQNASPIIISGVKVGSVTGISLDPAQQKEVVVKLTINRKYRIPVDSEARIFSNGLMGAKAIEIIYGDEKQVLESGDTLRSSHDVDLMAMAGSELEYFKKLLTKTATDFSRTLNNVSNLLEGNSGKISGTLQHLNDLTGNLNHLIVHERENLHETLENMSEFSSTLADNGGRIDSILLNINLLTAELQKGEFATSISDAAQHLNTLLSRIEAGEGSLGLLMKDPKLYESLCQTSDNLSTLLADLKKYPGRYVHLSLFGKDPEKMKARADRRAAKAAEKHRRDSLREAKKHQ